MVYDLTGKAVGYSDSDRDAALEVSLTAFATSLGYTVVRTGKHYSLKEMDSLIIYDDKSWNRFSGRGNITGGSQIDFAMEFAGLETVAEAIQYLHNFRGYTPDNTKTRQNKISTSVKYDTDKKMELPPQNEDYRRLFAYLTKTRGISQKTVQFFVDNKLIYEDKVHHNIVFLGYDKDKKVRYAGMRGTADIYGKKFKCDVPGNDKNYGVNLVNTESMEVVVFESVIDCMSWIDIYGRAYHKLPNLLVLGMVEDNPLEQFIKDYDNIKSITFCLDNDKAGHDAVFGKDDGSDKKMGLLEKYEKMGYWTRAMVPEHGKDFNDTLIEINKRAAESEKQMQNTRKGTRR